MSSLSVNYVKLKKLVEPQEGFATVEVQDNFLFKGEVVQVPQGVPVYLGNTQIEPGNKVIFAKYSPDTHEVEEKGEKYKYVNVKDLLEVL